MRKERRKNKILNNFALQDFRSLLSIRLTLKFRFLVFEQKSESSVQKSVNFNFQ